MKPIETSALARIWTDLNEMGDAQFSDLSMRFTSAQPVLSAYLAMLGAHGADAESLESEEDDQVSAETDLVAQMGMAVWTAMTDLAGRPLPQVTIEILEKVMKENEKLQKKLAEGSKREVKELSRILFQECQQHEALAFAFRCMLVNKESDPGERTPVKAVGLLHLKIMLDCLDRVCK